MAEAKVLSTFVFTKKQVEDYAKEISSLASQGWTVKAASEIVVETGCLCCKDKRPEMITILEK